MFMTETPRVMSVKRTPYSIRVLEEQAVSMVFWCAALSAERGKHLRLPNRHDGVVRSGQGLALDDRGGP